MKYCLKIFLEIDDYLWWQNWKMKESTLYHYLDEAKKGKKKKKFLIIKYQFILFPRWVFFFFWSEIEKIQKYD